MGTETERRREHKYVRTQEYLLSRPQLYWYFLLKQYIRYVCGHCPKREENAVNLRAPAGRLTLVSLTATIWPGVARALPDSEVERVFFSAPDFGKQVGVNAQDTAG
jgi:hypothetical protein